MINNMTMDGPVLFLVSLAGSPKITFEYRVKEKDASFEPIPI
jgi:hypothetical protein